MAIVPVQSGCEEEQHVSTRFYDINVAAVDAAGNVGHKSCSVIVVPCGHFKDQSSQEPKVSKKSSSKGARLFHTLKGSQDKGSKSQEKDGKSSKAENEVKPHNPNDLRLEYALSTQRYVISSAFLLWDFSLNTTLTIPPLPGLEFEEFLEGNSEQADFNSGGANKKSGVENMKGRKNSLPKGKSRCNQLVSNNKGDGGKKGGQGRKGRQQRKTQGIRKMWLSHIEGDRKEFKVNNDVKCWCRQRQHDWI